MADEKIAQLDRHAVDAKRSRNAEPVRSNESARGRQQDLAALHQANDLGLGL
jgi:hypothetical protein